MAYVKTTNGQIDQYPYTVGNLRRDNPNTSFPKRIPSEMLAEYGVLPVTVAERPAYDDKTYRIEQNAAPELLGGEWVLGYSLVALTVEEVLANTAQKAASVRSQRDALIAETDYLALSDTTLTPEMATYRQALRDITDHVNFPYLNDTDWPVKP